MQPTNDPTDPHAHQASAHEIVAATPPCIGIAAVHGIATAHRIASPHMGSPPPVGSQPRMRSPPPFGSSPPMASPPPSRPRMASPPPPLRQTFRQTSHEKGFGGQGKRHDPGREGEVPMRARRNPTLGTADGAATLGASVRMSRAHHCGSGTPRGQRLGDPRPSDTQPSLRTTPMVYMRAWPSPRNQSPNPAATIPHIATSFARRVEPQGPRRTPSRREQTGCAVPWQGPGRGGRAAATPWRCFLPRAPRAVLWSASLVRMHCTRREVAACEHRDVMTCYAASLANSEIYRQPLFFPGPIHSAASRELDLLRRLPK